MPSVVIRADTPGAGEAAGNRAQVILGAHGPDSLASFTSQRPYLKAKHNLDFP